ncbi:MAG: hypothetical protein IKT68_00560 [Clostridia bacterium]|nr:hypothetical protein [Clostridia bacterium]
MEFVVETTGFEGIVVLIGNEVDGATDVSKDEIPFAKFDPCGCEYISEPIACAWELFDITPDSVVCESVKDSTKLAEAAELELIGNDEVDPNTHHNRTPNKTTIAKIQTNNSHRDLKEATGTTGISFCTNDCIQYGQKDNSAGSSLLQ